MEKLVFILPDVENNFVEDTKEIAKRNYLTLWQAIMYLDIIFDDYPELQEVTDSIISFIGEQLVRRSETLH